MTGGVVNKFLFAGVLISVVGCSNTQLPNSASSESATSKFNQYSVSPSLGNNYGEIYYLIKDGDTWKVTQTRSLKDSSVEKLAINSNTHEIFLLANAPSLNEVSVAEKQRGPGSGNRWECFDGLGSNGYRADNQYSICSSNFAKGATGVGEAALGGLNLLFGTVKRMKAVDQEQILEVAKTSGLIELAEKKKQDAIAAAEKRQQDVLALSKKNEQERLDADKKAEEGDATAKYQRGLYYLGANSYNSEAEKWFVKAASSGSPDALYKLGQFQFNNYHNESEAERYWKKGALSGNVASQEALNRLTDERNRQAEIKREGQRQAKENADRVAKETQRIASFRKSIREGVESNCGPVIEVKANLVKISYAVANYGNEHWIKRDQVFPSEYGCRFYNGQYQSPQ